MRPTLSYDEFRSERFFSPLDGLRAISVLLVVTWHMEEKVTWGGLNGYQGVSIFFVLSGFLITTLCLREYERDGRISLAAFYIRRAFRILPLYVIAVVVFIVLYKTSTGHPATDRPLGGRLPYLLTMSADLDASHGIFAPAWSLGVEEKFYVLWPLILTWLVTRRVATRLTFTIGLLVALVAMRAGGSQYASLYIGITVGCILALILDDRRLYRLTARLLTPSLAYSALALLVVLHLVVDRYSIDPLYCVVTAVVIAGLLIRSSAVSTALSWRPAQWVGRRSYAIYLFHPVAISVVNRVIAPSVDHTSWSRAIPRLLGAIALSMVFADVTHRLVEKPLILKGRSLARRRNPRPRAVEAPA